MSRITIGLLIRARRALDEDSTLSVSDVAEGRDPYVVSRHLKSRGLDVAARRRDQQAKALEPALKVLNAGGRVDDAATAAGMDGGNLCRAMKRHYGKTPVQVRNGAVSRDVGCLLRLGLVPAQIGRAMGWSEPTVRRRARELGWECTPGRGHYSRWTLNTEAQAAK